MFTDSTTPHVSLDIQNAAEEVRAHLVYLRGGAPFLSSADTALLVQWLDQAIPTAVILHALEHAAERRRKRRSKIPLRLSHAKRYLPKAHQRLATHQPSATSDHPLSSLTTHLPSDAATTLLALPVDDPALLVSQACAIFRQVIDTRWQELDATDRATLRAQSEDELADLISTLRDDQREALIDETSRDLLRQRYPMLSAATVWSLLESS